MRERLCVLDHGRLAVDAALGRIGRPDHRHAAVALESRDEGGLLAVDERGRAFLDAHLHAEVGAEDEVAGEPSGQRLGDGGAQAFDGKRPVATDRDDRLRRPRREGRDEEPLEHEVRIPLRQGAVAERGRVTAHEVRDHDPAVTAGGARGTPLRRRSGSRCRRGRAGRRGSISSMTASGPICSTARVSPA